MIPGNTITHLHATAKNMAGYLRTGDQVSITSSSTGGNNWTRWGYDSNTDVAKLTEPLSATVSRTLNAGSRSH